MRQVKFRAGETTARDPLNGEVTESTVTASPEQIATTVREFFQGAPQPKVGTPVRPVSTRRAQRRRSRRPVFAFGDVRGLQDGVPAGRAVAEGRGRVGFPFYFPGKLPRGAAYATTVGERTYSLRGPGKRLHRAYRLVIALGPTGQYAGVQGTTWRDPPILKEPDATRTIRGRKLRLYSDGQRLRMVAWRTPRAVYWVHNSLSNTLSSNEMLAMAASLERP